MPAVSPAPLIARIRALVEDVRDPEIPVLNIADLGILRDVRRDASGTITVVITPTYSGCPAMDTIAADIRQALAAAGHAEVRIETQLAPAWTTDWLSAAGRAKLRAVGIAAPVGAAAGRRALRPATTLVPCPRCASTRTALVSEFGATPCKALYRCQTCLEPFDYFKCL